MEECQLEYPGVEHTNSGVHQNIGSLSKTYDVKFNF